MFQHGSRRKLRIGLAAGIGLGAVVSLLTVPHVWSQGPGVGNPNLGVPGASGLPPLSPPPTPGVVQVDPRALVPMDPQTPVQQCNEEVARRREEIKQLAAEREQKRAECQEIEARYKEAEKRLYDALQKKKQVLLRDVEVTDEELHSRLTDDMHTAASPYQSAGGLMPAKFNPSGSMPVAPVPVPTPRSSIPGAVFVPPSPVPSTVDQGPQWRSSLPGQQ